MKRIWVVLMNVVVVVVVARVLQQVVGTKSQMRHVERGYGTGYV